MQTGEALRTVADQYDVSKTALIRHKQHATRDHSGASWAVLAAEAQRLHQQALAARDMVGWVQVLRAMSRLLVKLCKTGEADKVGQRAPSAPLSGQAAQKPGQEEL